jgi:integrase
MSLTAPLLSASGDRPTPAVALTAVPSTAAAIFELERVLDVFRTVNRKAKDVVSDARLQQLEWVASELAIALPLGLSETAGDSLEDLLAPDAVHAYLLLARGGHLRSMPTVSTDPTSVDSSERIRIYCLEAFARQARIPFEAPDMPPMTLRPTVSPLFADLITAHLEHEASKWPEADRPDTIVRGLAMWGVMRDVLPRLGELESMLLDDLTLTAGTRTLTLLRQPQGGLRGRMPEPETIALSEDTVRLLDVWLDRRDKLITRLEGGVPKHLWLSAPPHPDAGVPIHRRGISKWYKKIADAVQKKQDAAGVPEDGLVPTRWETMRRTLLAKRQAREAA